MRCDGAKPGEKRAKGRRKVHYSKAEKAQHRALVEAMLIEAGTPSVVQFQATLRKGNPDLNLPPMFLSRSYIARIIERIAEQWQRESMQDNGIARASQVRRMRRYRDRALREKDFRAAVGFEKEIAKLQGNYAPIKLQVDLVQTQAMQLMLGGLSAEDLAKQLEVARRMATDAQRLRALEEGALVVPAEEPTRDSAE